MPKENLTKELLERAPHHKGEFLCSTARHCTEWHHTLALGSLVRAVPHKPALTSIKNLDPHFSWASTPTALGAAGQKAALPKCWFLSLAQSPQALLWTDTKQNLPDRIWSGLLPRHTNTLQDVEWSGKQINIKQYTHTQTHTHPYHADF